MRKCNLLQSLTDDEIYRLNRKYAFLSWLGRKIAHQSRWLVDIVTAIGLRMAVVFCFFLSG